MKKLIAFIIVFVTLKSMGFSQSDDGIIIHYDSVNFESYNKKFKLTRSINNLNSAIFVEVPFVDAAVGNTMVVEDKILGARFELRVVDAFFNYNGDAVYLSEVDAYGDQWEITVFNSVEMVNIWISTDFGAISYTLLERKLKLK